MAYDSKELKKTYNIPAPQHYNPTSGDWEVLYGRNNANRAELYDSNGQPVFGKNVELLAKTTITWNGIAVTNNVEVPVSSGDILVWIDNNCNKELRVTFENKVETNVWVPYDFGSNLSPIEATTGNIILRVEKFPKYLSGRIVVTANSAPTGTTTIQVQEV